MTSIPISLSSAGLLGLIYLALTFNVVRLRAATKVMSGDGAGAPGTESLTMAIRAHANFAEYVPLALILLGGLEAADTSRFVCLILAAMLVVGRVMHPVGMMRPAPNPWRAGGAILTWVVIGLASVGALLLAF